MSDQPWLVVGLGNPGPSFSATRHNVGRVVVELLAERVGGSFKAHRRGRADVAEVRLGDPPGTRVVLARPRSYMNESGGPVARLRDYFRVDHGPSRSRARRTGPAVRDAAESSSGEATTATTACGRSGPRSAPETSSGCGSASAVRRAGWIRPRSS